MRRLHLLMGALGCVAFALTGQFMKWHFPEVYGANDAARMLYRSAHIYILLTGIAQLLLGIYWRSAPRGWRHLAQRVGSCLLLPTPALVTIAFGVEPGLENLSRPLTFATVVLSIAGTALHLVATHRAQLD